MKPEQRQARARVAAHLVKAAQLLEAAHELAWDARLSDGLEADLALTAQNLRENHARLSRTVRQSALTGRVWAAMWTPAGWVEVRCAAGEVEGFTNRCSAGHGWVQ